MLQHGAGDEAHSVQLGIGRDQPTDSDGAGEDAVLVEVRNEAVHEPECGGFAGP